MLQVTFTDECRGEGDRNTSACTGARGSADGRVGSAGGSAGGKEGGEVVHKGGDVAQGGRGGEAAQERIVCIFLLALD